MNFGSAYTLHDSDDEDEVIRENVAAGPLSSMSPAQPWRGEPVGGTAIHLAAVSQNTLLPERSRARFLQAVGRSSDAVQQPIGTRPVDLSAQRLPPPTTTDALQHVGLPKKEHQQLPLMQRGAFESRTFLGRGSAAFGALPTGARVSPSPAQPAKAPPLPPPPRGPPVQWSKGTPLYRAASPTANTFFHGQSLACVEPARDGQEDTTRAAPLGPPRLHVGPTAKGPSAHVRSGIPGGPGRGSSQSSQPPGVQAEAAKPPVALAQAAKPPRPGNLPSCTTFDLNKKAAPRREAARTEPSARHRTWTRKVDTNILNVDMAALGDAAPFATGDATICMGCRACLSAVSILEPSRDASGSVLEGVYDWTCEYCGIKNGTELDEMEKPVDGQDSVDYMLEPAPMAATPAGINGKVDAGRREDESGVLFVIDTSGSMCVTTAVEGKLALRGDRTKDLKRLLNQGDDRSQLMPGQRRGMTYVSRLQAMQAAIDTELKRMVDATPSRHAGLVTFNSEVSLIGDGSGDARIVAGDRLSNMEALREVGRAYPLSRPVSEARELLTDRLFALEESGSTALGPAVVVGLTMLKERGGRGSRMVLCTDGLANTGLGALDELKNDEEREAAEAFYAELGRESAEMAVTVDVVSVDSEACDLENLGSMADTSGGTITRVKASELASNFAGILAKPILASRVSVCVILHKGLMFRNAGVADGANSLDRDIGNVTRETELSFEYQVRRRAERRSMGLQDNGVISSPGLRTGSLYAPSVPATPATPVTPGPPVSSLSSASTDTEGVDARGQQGAAVAQTFAPPGSAASPAVDNEAPESSAGAKGESHGGTKADGGTQAFLPFQVQIRYTRPDGTKCMRVVTKTQRVTKSKVEAEQSISMAVVAGHAASQAGNMASRGAYQSTRVSMRAWSSLMQRNTMTPKAKTQVARFGSDMAVLDSELQSAQVSEAADASEEDEGGAVNETLESLKRGRIRKSARSANDDLSYVAYKAKSASSKGYH